MWQARATLQRGVWASHCGGFSCCKAQALDTRASVVGSSWAPEFGLSTCGAWTQLPHGTWNPPGPGIEPMLPCIAGGFPSTVPPGKSP